MKREYTYIDNNIIHVIQLKKGQNKKLGVDRLMIQTYHFDIDQVENIDLTLDANNCLDCPFSFSNNDPGKSSCYTHKGLQGLGLRSMLKRLNKLLPDLEPFNQGQFNLFVSYCAGQDIELVRFGAYGEPVLLRFNCVQRLAKLGRNYTGYTHQWNKPQYQEFSQYFMASIHNGFEQAIANDMHWRCFITTETPGAINCPASKEAGYKSVCSKCALCSGTAGKGNKDIFIHQH